MANQMITPCKHVGTMHDMMVVQVSMMFIKTFLVNFLKT